MFGLLVLVLAMIAAFAGGYGWLGIVLAVVIVFYIRAISPRR